MNDMALSRNLLPGRQQRKHCLFSGRKAADDAGPSHGMLRTTMSYLQYRLQSTLAVARRQNERRLACRLSIVETSPPVSRMQGRLRSRLLPMQHPPSSFDSLDRGIDD